MLLDSMVLDLIELLTEEIDNDEQQHMIFIQGFYRNLGAGLLFCVKICSEEPVDTVMNIVCLQRINMGL